MDQPVEPRPRRLKRSAITSGAAVGAVGIPLSYAILQAVGLIISDPLLLACVLAPTIILLALTLVPKLRAWALQAAIASAITSVVVVLVIVGGITFVANMLSDPVA